MIKPSDPQILQIKNAKNYQKRYITTRKTKNKQNSAVLQGKNGQFPILLLRTRNPFKNTFD